MKFSVLERTLGIFCRLTICIVAILPMQTSAVSALSPEQKDVYLNHINYFDVNTCDTGSSSPGSVDTTGAGTISNDPSTPKNGQSLGGVAGTGFTQAEIDQAKAANHSSASFSGAADFNVTTYGPPWDSVEGGGTTSTGLSLHGPDNGHGRPRYEIAVDPSVIPYGSLVTVWPNAVNWHGPFLAADTGGAIVGHHVDVYDWSGDGTKDTFSRNNGKVEPYTGSLTDAVAPNSGTDSTSTAACCSSASNVTPGAGAPDGTTFPNLDPNAMANAIDKYIVQINPSSELKGLGATIVASAKHANISPFLVPAIAQQESSMADPGDFNVKNGNNAFGRSAAPGQPSFQGARPWYKWSSVKASVDYTAPENQNVSAGDFPSYIRAIYGAAVDSNDLVTFFNKYAPASDGNNTVQYIKDVKSRIQTMANLASGQSGDTSVSSNSTCCPPDGSSATGPSDTTKPSFIDMSGPPVNGTGMGHGKLSKINALVIHYTEGNSEGGALRSFFASQGKGYGVQFNIGLTGKVYQYFPLNDMQVTWHVGDINSHSIGIEITGADGDALMNNAAQFSSVVGTVKFLCSYYNIPCSSPKGDITGDHNSPDQAQGLLGHSEAPNPTCGSDCNHSDPDTKIVGNTEYNITTGKVWTDADRQNSSIHAYMMKLRTALGFNPTPGNNGSGTGTVGPTNSASCPPPPTTSGGLVWPFATKDPSQYNRVDQGWDLAGKAGENIYAIAAGTLHIYAPNPGPGLFGNDYPIEELDNSIGGPQDDKWIYYGHAHIDHSLIGQHVQAGQVIGHVNRYYNENGSGVQPGWLEIGFSQAGNDAPLDPPPFPTPAGTKMKELLLNAQPAQGGG